MGLNAPGEMIERELDGFGSALPQVVSAYDNMPVIGGEIGPGETGTRYPGDAGRDSVDDRS